jgi:probable HAF family extracellular repeat protein
MNTSRTAAILFCTLVVSYPALGAQPKRFKVTTLPEWEGGTLEPCAMNDHGQVVGLIRPDKGQMHLFLWEHETGVQDLGPVYPKRCDINNKGQIVGTVCGPDDEYMQAFIREPDGTVQTLGGLSGVHSEATAINDQGQVVGLAFVAIPGVYHAFIWDRAHGMRDLGAPNGIHSGATAISETGQVFGYVEHSQGASRLRRPFCWELTDSTGFDSRETPGRDFYDMNARGWLVGKYTFEDGPHVVLWRGGAGFQKLFPCASDQSASQPLAWTVNDVNQVVCTEKEKPDPFWREKAEAITPPEHRYLWDPAQGRISLDDYMPPQTRKFTVRDLNNRGWILGVAHLEDGDRRVPLLLEQTPAK